MYKYRSEILFGEGYRDAANVMAHETFELMNTDIARTLSTSILKGTDAGHKLEILEEEINNYCSRRKLFFSDSRTPSRRSLLISADKPLRSTSR